MSTTTISPSYLNYGRDFAGIYDTIFPPALVTETELDWLTAHTPPGSPRILELGIGTGRIALPLAKQLIARGDTPSYTGIEISAEMLDALAGNDTHNHISATQGDITTAEYGHDYDVVLCVCATISMITDPAAQQLVFDKAAAALRPGGILIVETHNADFVQAIHTVEQITYAVPYPGGQRALVSFSTLTGTAWHIDHCWIDNGTTHFLSEDSRTTTPTELDTYATTAGLLPVSHTSGLGGAEIASTSGTVTAVYRKTV